MRIVILKMLALLFISFSLCMMIIYLNYLYIGYNFLEYVYFIKWNILLIIISGYILYKLR